MILKYFFPFLLFISINFASLAALPNNDNFNKLRKINFVENVELAKEKLILKDYQGVINLLSINIKSNDIPDSYLVESLINRGNAYFLLIIMTMQRQTIQGAWKLSYVRELI